MDLDMNDPRPSYVQLADRLRREIADGVYAPGGHLPSVRGLADEYGVAPGTAAKAVDELKREGIVFGRPGVGTIVREAPAPSSSPSVESLQEQIDDLRRRVQTLEGGE